MYGFSLNNNIAGQQMDPLQRFGATQLGFGSLPGAPNGQYGGSTDSISPFGGGGYASNPGFGWNGASNGGLNGGNFGGFGSSSSAGLASMLGSFGSYVQNLFGQIAQWIQNYSCQLQTAASGQSSAAGQGSSFGSAAGPSIRPQSSCPDATCSAMEGELPTVTAISTCGNSWTKRARSAGR